jgi:hypothetical protein
MLVGRRDVFLRFVVIALIVFVGGFVVMMFGGGVGAGSANVDFRTGMLGSRTCRDDCLSLFYHTRDCSGTMTFW